MLWVFALAFGLLAGCSPDAPPNPAPAAPAPDAVSAIPTAPIVRVLLLEGRSSLRISAEAPPTIHTASPDAARRLGLSPGVPSTVQLQAGAWTVGNVPIGEGLLEIDPATDGDLTLERRRYHGTYRLVPTSPNTFDVVNVVPIDAYIQGVLPGELRADWLEQTYQAQAIVSRTYAIYCAKAGRPADVRPPDLRPWFDLFADERSQVYGGITAETPKAVDAVTSTAGQVVAYGEPGHERIIKAYFSSCCGGVGQSAADAFGDPPTVPLTEQAVGTCCSASPHYSWPDVVLGKAELTRRLRAYGMTMNRSEKNLASVTRIDIAASNSLGRPVKFAISDVQGHRLILSGQELRLAINAGATPTTRLLSTNCQVSNEPTAVRFFNGHGAGHGVGMCQWCAEARAAMGMPAQAIVTAAFPGAVVLRAY